MNLLPIFEDGKIKDGAYIHAQLFCKNNCCKGKCQEYYASIKNNGGFCCCPYGMSSYTDVNTGLIFTGFRHKNYYNKNLAKNISGDSILYNPLLHAQQIEELLKASIDSNLAEKDIDEKKVTVDSISHEAKKLNAQIKERCEVALQTYSLLDDEHNLSESDIREIQTILRTIYVSSSMIDSRFSMLNYEKNPDALTQGPVFECNIYKKFHKMQKIFRNYQKRNIPIEMCGESYARINAYQSFDLIPLLIIENAIKYSYSYNNSVNINFNDDLNGNLIVEVSSYSPYCSAEDISHLFEKGYRGKNAKKVPADGSGIGLYLVKLLCDVHNITITITSNSEKITQINGVPYSMFVVRLSFKNLFY